LPERDGSEPGTRDFIGFKGVRLAYVITRSDTIGGAHVHVADLAEYFLSVGAKVSVFAGGEGPFSDRLRDRGLDFLALHHLCRPISPLKDVLALKELRKALKAFNPDLVLAHSAKAGLLARLAARILRVPVILTVHGWSFTDGVGYSAKQLYSFTERLAAPLADRIITVSEHDRELALRHGVGKTHQIRVVHHGAHDVPRELRATPSKEPVRLISVARLDVQKDHEGLLRVLAELKDLPWELDLIGDGPHDCLIRQLILELGLSPRVRLLGLRHDVPRLLADAQMFALISHWEGLPISIIEAMRAGLPVVASRVGGITELVIDKQTGYLAPRGDVQILRNRMECLLRSPEKRQEMGRAGRARFEMHFRFDRMVEGTAALYREALGYRR
jgi:glycosyltransferase involved in cell wall biosynthesis